MSIGGGSANQRAGGDERTQAGRQAALLSRPRTLVVPAAAAAAVSNSPSFLFGCGLRLPGGEEIIAVPSMGDSITEGTIVEWTKQPGDSVELDEVVVVLETDKVSKWNRRVGYLYD